MKKFLIKKARLESKTKITEDIFLFKIARPSSMPECKPGQFINIALKERSLRRPLSIFNADKKYIYIIFRICGSGTEILASTPAGGRIDLMGPLGKPFPSLKLKPLFVSGGMGMAPLFFLSLRYPLKGTFIYAVAHRREFTDMKKVKEKGHRIIKISECTDKCTAVDGLEKHIEEAGVIYTAGPRPMLKKVSQMCLEKDKDCYLSWEERMGCGTGLCRSCVVKTTMGYKLSCSDGPVFNARDINWNEY